MSTPTKTIGTQIDAAAHVSSPSFHISTRRLMTLQDLLTELVGDKQIGMLRTTAGHIAAFLNSPVEQVAIEALVGIVPDLRTHLTHSHYKRNAVNSYCNYAGVLLRKAKELGWVESKPEIPEAWEPIVAAVKPLKGAIGIVRFAISRGKAPANMNDDDLDNWARMMLAQGRCYEYIYPLLNRFRSLLLKAGLSHLVPGVYRNWKSSTAYSVPLRDFPSGLRQEAMDVLTWRQAAWVETKRKKRLRAVSARNLEQAITRLYGFLVNVRPLLRKQVPLAPGSIHNLTDLARRENVSAFASWWLNVRNGKGRSLVVMLGCLCAALKEHPNYSGVDFSWFDDLIRGIPFEPESSRRERKERKYLPYETVADIPRKIHEGRKEAAKLGPTAVARMVHDELLIKWITVLPWRQRNLRECRLGLKSEGANLFKAEIEQWDTAIRPKWVQDKLKENPHEQFWQYHFREAETKNGREVRSILPLRLVSLLEEYLQKFRPLLIKGVDPHTLFVNEDGARLTDSRMVVLVSKLTLRYAGRRVTPHIFRDIFAYWWLSSHPEDYLTVSKKLWHRSIQTTLRIYGCKFDESKADCRVEEWLDGNKM